MKFQNFYPLEIYRLSEKMTTNIESIHNKVITGIEALITEGIQEGVRAYIDNIILAISRECEIDVEKLREIARAELKGVSFSILGASQTSTVNMAEQSTSEAPIPIPIPIPTPAPIPAQKQKKKKPEAKPTEESLSGGCPYIFRRGRVGETCGARPKKGTSSSYCAKHQKCENDRPVSVPDLPKPLPVRIEKDPSLRLVRLNKEVNKFVHKDTGLFVRSKEDSTIVGSYRDGVLKDYLTDDDVVLCEKYGFLFERGNPPAEKEDVEEKIAEYYAKYPEKAPSKVSASVEEKKGVVTRSQTNILSKIPKPTSSKSTRSKKQVKDSKPSTSEAENLKEQDIEDVLSKILGDDNTDTEECEIDNNEEEEELALEDEE